MFFYLSKIFGYFINPTAWVFMSLLAALILRRRKRRIFLVTALILFYVFSNNTLLNTFLAPWEKDGVVKVEKTYDVGIVLGGWIAEEDQRLDRVVFKKVPDRLFQAYRLYRQGKVKKLLISGGSGHYLYPHKKEALAIERYLLSIGVPEEDILTESQSRNTHENAVNSASILKSQNLDDRTIILITSAFHMKRSIACFEKQKINVIAYPVDYQQVEFSANIDWIIPSGESLNTWKMLFKEQIGIWMYKLAGYI